MNNIVEVGYVHFGDQATMVVYTDGEDIYGKFPNSDQHIYFATPEQLHDACRGFASQHLEIDEDEVHWENA